MASTVPALSGTLWGIIRGRGAGDHARPRTARVLLELPAVRCAMGTGRRRANVDDNGHVGDARRGRLRTRTRVMAKETASHIWLVPIRLSCASVRSSLAVLVHQAPDSLSSLSPSWPLPSPPLPARLRLRSPTSSDISPHPAQAARVHGSPPISSPRRLTWSWFSPS